MLYPVKFEPIFKQRIWGGRRLEQLFGKLLPAGQNIGESWELSGLPGNESIVASGPLAGHRLTDLVNRFGPALLGSATMSGGQFPLLIKLLDARQPLSVQVHPGRAGAPGQLGLAGVVEPGESGARPKNECWYIVDAEPGARIWIGLKEGVDRERFAAAVRSSSLVSRAVPGPGPGPGPGESTESLLHVQPVRAGDFFHLPPGTVHALGAGIVVAEVQTPSDTTYRLFDWNRIDPTTGAPRKLHVAEALEAMACAPPPAPAKPAEIDGDGQGSRLLTCADFAVSRVRLPAGSRRAIGGNAQMTVWQVLSGRGAIDCGDGDLNANFVAGELLLIPAEMPAAAASILADCELLEITIPNG